MPSYPLPAAHPLPSAPPLKKEKPLYKIPVPGSPWIRIKTTHNNIFFSHSETKESVWTVPEDIAEIAASLDWDSLEEEAAQQKEITRLQKEVERDNLKRKATVEDVTPVSPHAVDDDSAPPKKRKKRAEVIDEAPVAIDEIIVARDDATDEVGEEGDDDDEDEDGSEAAFSTSSAEDAWQREMAEGMAKLAAEEAAAAAGEPAAPPIDPTSSVSEPPDADEGSALDEKAFAVPKQVNLSHEEARTLFKVRHEHSSCHSLSITRVLSIRRSLLKRIRIPSPHSPLSCPSSSPTRAMSYSRIRPIAKPLSTSGVVIPHANPARQRPSMLLQSPLRPSTQPPTTQLMQTLLSPSSMLKSHMANCYRRR